MAELNFLSSEIKNEVEIDSEDLEFPDKTASRLPNGARVCTDFASSS